MMKTMFRAAVAALLLLVGTVIPVAAQELSDQQKAEIRTIVRDYILEHPEIIPEAMEVLRARMTSDMISSQAEALFKDPDVPEAGNPEGDVTIVEFFDYACGYCKAMLPRIQRALLEDGGIRLRLIEFPILSDASITAAKAALAARMQDKYTSFHMALMGTKGRLTEDLVFDVAEKVGLDVKRLKQDMNRPEIGRMINENRELARALRIEGTPALIVERQMASGAISYEDLMEMVEDARTSKARKNTSAE